MALADIAASPFAQAPAPAEKPGGRFVGSALTYRQILTRGAVLLFLTLGIYRFWLVTDLRRFLWAHTEIAGDGLEYTGTARELLLGFLMALALLVPVYVLFFIASLDLGLLGPVSAVLGFLLLAVLGQFAVYRARRYRLTRTIFRGLRFLQTGSAWRYAISASLWWLATIFTLGLAFPWAQASLERYKMRHTAYGTLPGHFAGSGTRLFVRGFLMWLMVIGPFVLGVVVAIVAIDWLAIADALGRGGSDVVGRIEGASPNFGLAVAFVGMSIGWAIMAAAVLYPIFQAMILRWWTSGVRFGDIAAVSRLRTGQVYGAYLRFLVYALMFTAAWAAITFPGLYAVKSVAERVSGKEAGEIATAVWGVLAYIVLMLGSSTIYQATVKFRLWALAFATIELSGLGTLDKVKAAGAAASPLGEGLADALDVGGL